MPPSVLLRGPSPFGSAVDFDFTRQSAGPLWRGRSHSWDPAIDVTHKNDVLTINADLPGLKRDEVSVESSDHAVTIQGERKREFEEERDGVFRSDGATGPRPTESTGTP